MRTPLACLVFLILSAPLLAQDTHETTPPSGDPSSLPQAVANHPGFLLGRRAAAVLDARIVNPTLVIVDSPTEYVDALALWSRRQFFPILIDDGTDNSAHDIARFVRAFEPASIVRWRPEDVSGGALTDRINRAMASAWSVDSVAELMDALRGADNSPGAVAIASETHPAWTAAAAFACARAMPIAWIDERPGNPNGVMSPADARALSDAASRLAADLDFSWESLRDDIDAIAICLRVPGRIRDDSRDNETFRALTDVVGRHDDGRRWAYASWIFGDEATSAYQAMCSIFLTTDSAWLFDGYAPDFAPPYALNNSARMFEQSDLPVTLTPGSAGDRRTWRDRTALGIDASFIHVNSAGKSDWFNLNNDRTYASDIPELLQPAVVSFIHSFSAQAPANGRTIAAHFLHSGAFAYIGSMHEPTLGAFLPLDNLLGRLGVGMPLCAAPRQDGAPAWRIQIIGDPLYVISAPRSRLDIADPPEGSTPLDHILVEQLEANDLARAARSLAMLARDDDLIRLARSVLDEFTSDADASRITPQQMTTIARIALPLVARTDDPDLFARLYLALDSDTAERSDLRDLLWRTLRRQLDDPDVPPLHVSLLRAHIRDDTMVEDAADLRAAIERTHGHTAVVDLYVRLIDRAPNDRTRRRLTQDAPR